MTRLTNTIRDALLKELITRAFQKRAQEMVDRCAAFAIEVYKDVYESEGKLKKIEALPKGWLPTDNDIKVNMSGKTTTFYFTGNLENYGMSSEFKAAGVVLADVWMPFPNKDKSKLLKQYDGTHPLAIKYDALSCERSELITEISRAQKTTAATLYAVGSLKKLVEIWPEVEDLARPYFENGEQRAILPAVQRSELNKILDLPPETRP